MVISIGSKHFNDTIANLNDGYVKCTAAQVEYHDLLLISMIQTIRKRSTGRLIDDTLYIQPCDLSRILCRLSLGIIEIRRYCDNSILYRFAQIRFCILTEFAQDHRTDLGSCIFFTVDLNAPVCAHRAFYRADGALTVHNSLSLCSFADQLLAILCKSDNRGSCARPFCIGNDDRSAAFNYRNTAIGRSKVYTDCFSHDTLFPF